MRRFVILLAALFAPVALFAQVNVAKFTPRQVYAAVAQSGWIHLGETKGASYWYAYWSGQPQFGIAVVVKSANKGIGKNYTTIQVVSGMVSCAGSAQGNYPTYLANGFVEVDSAANGYPLPSDDGADSNLGSVPINRGSALADAVKKTCDSLSH